LEGEGRMRRTISKLKHSRFPEHLLVVACVVGSMIWGGFTFFAGTAKNPSRQVTFVTSDSTQRLLTASRTVGDFLRDVGIEPSDGDFIQPPIQTPVTPGIVVYYRKSVNACLVDAGQPEKRVACTGGTVCDLLDSAGIALGPLDRVVPPQETRLTPGLHVEVTRIAAIDLVTRQEIPPTVTYQPDPTLGRGQTEIIDPGKPGSAEETTRVYYVNGEETSRVEIGTKVLADPTTQVTRVGTRPYPQLVSRGGQPRPALATGSVMTMVATAYDPSPASCWPYSSGRTATGQKATRGVCAVDPRVIPLGTKLWVEGYGYALACDTGGAIKGNRIDVCFDTPAEAARWGRKTVKVYILE
jgi:uncharacterized protein YabE (DUF348 family)/3D (Asp-Asp-Asp) domain-containing protein